MKIWKQYNDACTSLDITFEQSKDEVLVKKTYRKLVLKHHPDKGGNAQKFITIEEANTIIKTYSESIDSYKPRNPSADYKFPSFEELYGEDDYGFFSEYWFERWQQQKTKKSTSNWPKNCHLEMVITIPEIIDGFAHDVSYVRKEACKICNTGCLRCETRAYTRHSIKATLHINSFALNYNGNLEYKHLGDQGRNNIKNLIIKLHIDKSDPFQFKTYRNRVPDVVLNYTLYLSKMQKYIMVKDLEGNDIKVKLPKEVKEGQYLRIKNKGVFYYNTNNERTRTNLLVKLNLHK